MILTTAEITRHTGFSAVALHDLDRREILRPSLRGADGTGSRRLYSASDLAALVISVNLRARNVAWPVIGELTRHVQQQSLDALEAKPVFVLFQGPDNQTEIHAVKDRKDFIAPDDGMAVFIDVRPTIAHVRKIVSGTATVPKRSKSKAGRR